MLATVYIADWPDKHSNDVKFHMLTCLRHRSKLEGLRNCMTKLKFQMNSSEHVTDIQIPSRFGQCFFFQLIGSVAILHGLKWIEHNTKWGLLEQH